MTLNIFDGFGHVLYEVAFALIPLLIFFLFFQFFILKLPKKKLLDILKGMILTFWGLAFFLQGVHIGFLPAGEMMGTLMGQLDHLWMLIPIGFLLGFVATFAEPAVRILNHEVEKVSGGYIPKKVMLYTLSIGVAISIALSMLRIIAGIPLWYFIIPGYLIALILIKFSTPTFTAIAFDSGGVATGPMTVTFIVAMSVGIATVLEGRDPLLDGFGMITLVALSPILSVLTLGLLYGRKEKENEQKIKSEA
ncbi:DUF1538 domain-containing protein [Alkalihalophilus marmarensis]|jgi:hypothetical protein|uniref:DUF1538 domain-containing protein n=1 Tax=Alkalihalophilus marmarensis DSM 21297 TaxID=1188261 RepID=U6SLF6_9BACI|nr:MULTISPECIES: DUF1538 domain-containing protein [Alkalihalophilus]ERN51755.1 hypothetical protein A33I_01175 [Alkalihalophilus marmarensis DSM 21297]MCM3491280.1 DUF1538 domain-containing protein [Alkalihalophilus marmarensis]WEG17273.1 DUF1538 domain-containing protein [Alkalihalophilus pseudofirmus]